MTTRKAAPHQPRQAPQVEELFSSYGRVKIMGIMMESNELNISEITRRSGISHSSVEVHLELLVELGLLTEKRFNRIRIFRGQPLKPLHERGEPLPLGMEVHLVGVVQPGSGESVQLGWALTRPSRACRRSSSRARTPTSPERGPRRGRGWKRLPCRTTSCTGTRRTLPYRKQST
jgi:DNA-binding transcriptional ArsR family regulator